MPPSKEKIRQALDLINLACEESKNYLVVKNLETEIQAWLNVASEGISPQLLLAIIIDYAEKDRQSKGPIQGLTILKFSENLQRASRNLGYNLNEEQATKFKLGMTKFIKQWERQQPPKLEEMPFMFDSLTLH